ncbi:Ff.00g054880.m01.CDS01 [Fusarium sp. VM40]|nr:Ff.00g054880.m01.CDS01 [Fusarium sp. VM40]
MCQGSAEEVPITGILPAQHWAEQPQDDKDTDSSLGNDDESSTASISSSILHYRTIQGRSYHSEQGNAQYWGSNDEAQSELMDINHHVLTLGIGGKLYLAPIEPEDLKLVVDIGTGTGIWAIDFADDNPNVRVVGTDLSPIQPGWIPPNLQFEIEDCTRQWTFEPDSIDYIHMRWLVGSIPDWGFLYSEAFRCCKPGGWIESHETSSIITSDDGTVAPKSAMDQWGKFFIEGGKNLGSTFTVIEDEVQKREMEKAGLVDIHEFEYKCPIGGWPKDSVKKEMGRYMQFMLETDTEGTVLFMAHTLGWSKEEIHVYIAHLRKEMRAGKSNAYHRQKVIWGRKPAVEGKTD